MRNISHFLTTIALASSICVGKACIWDDDTLSIEAKGLPTTVDAIVGRLDINPPEYYTQRIFLSQDRIAKNFSDYEAFDNIAVAHDKLGNYDSAIATLARKREQLEKDGVKPTSDPLRDPLYRYHANLGTVYAHQWVGEKRGRDVELLDKAIEEISRAIKINPKAHFGRERVQLGLLKMLREVSISKDPARGFQARKSQWEELVQSVGEKATTEALIGIMLMGNSAESRDFMTFLLSAVPEDDFYVKTLAIHRNDELKIAGKPVLLLDIESIASEWLPRSNYILRAQYGALRENAKQYRENRNEYMHWQFMNKKHPDTDPDFWNRYEPIPRVNVAALEPRKPLIKFDEVTVMTIAVSSIGLVILIWVGLFVRKVLKARK